MVESEKIPDMVRQANKIIIWVLDPEQDRKMRELENQLSTLIESNAILTDYDNLKIDYINSELKR